MRKKTITIGALLLAMNCFSQTDTTVHTITGKDKIKFNYYTSEPEEVLRAVEYYDFKFKLKKDEYFVLDLFDDVGRDILYLLYRDVTVYYRDGEVEKLYFSSDDNTIYFDGSFIKKIIVHKPELK